MATEQAMAALAKKIANKRAGRGIRETAKEVGVSAATLSRVENGNVSDLVTFRKICAWLKEDPGAILGLSPVKPDALEVRVHFRKERVVGPKTAKALAEMILLAQKAMQEAEEF
jgi:transcriptional regulator with XRE-family HTH domain